MTEVNEYEGEVVDNVEIYTDRPDYDVSGSDELGNQDEGVPFAGRELFASSVRTAEEVLEWYRTHQTAREIGFDPDGACLRVVRTPRNIAAKYLTAKSAQDNTPTEHRVLHVADLRKTMVAYFDDPFDSNRAGHVVTMIGRVPGFDPHDLDDCLFETNSVKANELVIVRGEYFHEHWGDSFQFGATILNDVVLPLAVAKYESKVEKFNDDGPVYHLNLLARAGKDRPAIQTAYDDILSQVKSLPDSRNRFRVRRFKDQVLSNEQLMDMALLNDAVKAGGGAIVGRVRDEITRILQSLPDV